jgi:hypothetical protein
MERTDVERMVQRWHEARDTGGGDPELEYGDRHPDCVIEFPQSGEAFDRDGLRGWQREHPGGAPRTKLERLTGHGDEWTLEATLDYGPERGGIWHLVKTLEFKDGKVIRDTRYFAEPFEAPQGRAKWTKGGG